MTLTFLKNTDCLFYWMSLNFVLSDVSPRLDSGYAFLVRISQKYPCILLDTSYHEEHDVSMTHYWWFWLWSLLTWCLQAFSSIKLVLLPLYLLSTMWEFILRPCVYLVSHQTSAIVKDVVRCIFTHNAKSHSVKSNWMTIIRNTKNCHSLWSNNPTSRNLF